MVRNLPAMHSVVSISGVRKIPWRKMASSNSCLENSWWATAGHGVANSQIQLSDIVHKYGWKENPYGGSLWEARRQKNTRQTRERPDLNTLKLSLYKHQVSGSCLTWTEVDLGYESVFTWDEAGRVKASQQWRSSSAREADLALSSQGPLTSSSAYLLGTLVLSVIIELSGRTTGLGDCLWECRKGTWQQHRGGCKSQH